MCSYSLASFAKRHQKSFVLFGLIGLFSSAACYYSFFAITAWILSILDIFVPFVPTIIGIIITSLYMNFLMVSLEKKWSIKKTQIDILDDDII